MTTEQFKGKLTRRSFLKGTTGAVAGAVALGGLSACSTSPMAETGQSEEKVVVCNCRNNCHWHCAHDVTVRDGVVVNSTMHEFPEPEYSSICQRGVSLVQRMYSPKRVKYPMRRVEGTERGAGQWERISWDDAIAEVVEKFSYYRDNFGGSSIMMDNASGSVAMLAGQVPGRLSKNIGMSSSAVLADYNAGHAPARVLGAGPGSFDFCNEPRSAVEAKLIVFWGSNTAVSMPHLWRMDMMAKDKGAKLIAIDPVRSVTSYKCDDYIQIRPGSDLYLALAISNYLIQNDLYDHDFVMNRSNAPFLVRRDTGEVYCELEDPSTRTEADYYVYDPVARKVCRFDEAGEVALEGSYDINGVQVDTVFTLLKKNLAEYTVEKASDMCQIPQEVIVGLADDMATIKPMTIHCTYGTDHYNNGFEAVSAMLVLQGLLGNYGRPGAGFAGIFAGGPMLNYGAFGDLKNMAEPGPAINVNDLSQAFATQTYLGQSQPLKAILTMKSNILSNAANSNEFYETLLPNVEYWVVVDRAWSDTANHADLVLPCAEYYESSDVRANQALPFVSLGDAAVEPAYEAKDDLEIVSLIGRGMGYEEDWPETFDVDYWPKKLLDGSVVEPHLSFENMKKEHVVRGVGENFGPAVSQGTFNWNPNFGTKSGRVELYWEDPVSRFDYGQKITDDMIRDIRLVHWVEPDEAWPTNPLFEKYPLVLITPRSRFRTHTQHFENPLFDELEREPYVRMSAEDLASRGLTDGQYVEVFNDRGHAVVRAIQDPSYPAGVIAIPKGWQLHQFVAGGFQELTSPVTDAWGVGGPFYDCLVDVREWTE